LGRASNTGGKDGAKAASGKLAVKRGPMQWFYNLKIAKKLICVVAMVLGFSIFLGLFSVQQLSQVNQAAAEMKDV
jgi:hypothetical protein